MLVNKNTAVQSLFTVHVNKCNLWF